MGCLIFEAYGTDGDILPFIRIGKQLAMYGHKVAVATHSYYEEKVKGANLDFIAVDTPSEYAQFINENAAISQNPRGHITFVKRNLLPRVLPTYAKIKEYYIPNQTVILGRVPGFISTLVAEKLNLPRISLFIAPTFVMQEEFVRVFFNFFKDEICSIRREMGLPAEYDWEKWWKTAQRYVGLWPKWFGTDNQGSGINVEKVGFVVDTNKTGYLPDEVIKLISEDEKPVLINSSSSSLFINSDYFEATIKACELLGQKAIITGRHREFLPERLPEGIHFFNHLEYGTLMPKVKAVIHHGGAGTSAQALAAGLPQLVLAGGVDRPDNAMSLKALGVGEYLLPPQWNYKQVMEAFQRVITSPSIKKKCLEIAERMEKEDPIGAIRNMVEPLLKNNTVELSSYKSCRQEGNSGIMPEMGNANGKETETGAEKEIELEKLIENLSQEELELILTLSEKKDESGKDTENFITRQPRKEGVNLFPLSYIQEEFWFLHKLQPDCLALNVPSAYVIKGPLNINALEKTFNEIIRRHENLRTCFREIDGEPIQYILPRIDFKLPVIYLQHVEKEKQYKMVKKILTAKTYEPFDFSNSPLFRITLVKLDEDEHIIWWVMHHILNDGYGTTVFINEIKELYSWFAYGKKHNLPELKIQCADFAVWQKAYLNGDRMDEKLKYWKNQLSGYKPNLSLPADYARPAVQTFSGSEEFFYISKSVDLKLKELSCKAGVSLFMVLISAFKLLIYSFTNQTDIVVGSPVSLRNQEVLDNLICDFSNMLLYRTILDENDSVYDVLRKVKKVALGAFQNQEAPSQEVFYALNKEKDPAYSPLFQMMFVFHQIFPQENDQFLEGLKTKYFNIEKKSSQFDISLFMFDDNQDGLYGRFEYNTDLYSRKTVLKFINYFKVLLETVTENPDIKISELSTLIEKKVLKAACGL